MMQEDSLRFRLLHFLSMAWHESVMPSNHPRAHTKYQQPSAVAIINLTTLSMLISTATQSNCDAYIVSRNVSGNYVATEAYVAMP